MTGDSKLAFFLLAAIVRRLLLILVGTDTLAPVDKVAVVFNYGGLFDHSFLDSDGAVCFFRSVGVSFCWLELRRLFVVGQFKSLDGLVCLCCDGCYTARDELRPFKFFVQSNERY